MTVTCVTRESLYKESVPTIMGSSHTPPTKFPQSIGPPWERATALMNPYPAFLPPHPPPPSHLQLPMGSTPGIAPDDHFSPPDPDNNRRSSRSISPPPPNLGSIVNHAILTAIICFLNAFLDPQTRVVPYGRVAQAHTSVPNTETHACDRGSSAHPQPANGKGHHTWPGIYS